MLLKNGTVYYDGKFITCDISFENGKIVQYSENSNEESKDCLDCYIIPGLVDIHTHGCMGFDFSSSSTEDICKMREYYLKNGITSVLATTVAMSNDDIVKSVDRIKQARSTECKGADILGINLEGPYLSPKKCGAHDITLLKEPDIDFVNSLGDIIKIVDLAPEYKTSMDFIRKFNGKVSVAHTDCDYEKAMEAFREGADHITHIFNAMNGLHHRKPGVIGAFFDSNVTAEIICDGVHIVPPVLRMMFQSKPNNLAVISDSMAATGLDDGVYKLGKLTVYVKNSVATLEDGTLAGSTMNIFNMMKNLISIGVAPETAIKSVTEIPATSIGYRNSLGQLKPGYDADFIITDKEFNIKNVFLKGQTVIEYKD